MIICEPTKSRINLLENTSEELRKAFDSIEGERFYDYSVMDISDPTKEYGDDELVKAHSSLDLNKAFEWLEGMADDESLTEEEKSHHNFCVYGRGGGNRYPVDGNGWIFIYSLHLSQLDESRILSKVEAAGFGIR